MRHNRKQVKLGRTAAHRRALFRNLLSSLFLHGRIVTTEAKAREVKRRADALIGLARTGTLHARRLAAARLFGAEAVRALFDRWAPSFPDRVSGFPRSGKLGFRQGDASQMVVVEILGAAPEATSEASQAKD